MWCIVGVKLPLDVGKPCLALAEFVRTYTVLHFIFDAAADIPYKPYPPRPEHCLSFYPRDTETIEYANSGKKVSNLKIVVIGQQNEVTNRYVGRDFMVFQVVFRPGALYRLTGIPSHNSYVDAETVFANDIKEVNAKLGEATKAEQMVIIVESFLNRLAKSCNKGPHGLDQVSGLLLHTKKNPSIEQLASDSCLSLRQYERKFIERVRVPPKYFNRIIRFENAFRMKNKHPHLDWLTIAIQCGYYDYQHLAKDYKEFTRHTPTNFHLLDLSSPERKFGEADTY